MVGKVHNNQRNEIVCSLFKKAPTSHSRTSKKVPLAKDFYLKFFSSVRGLFICMWKRLGAVIGQEKACSLLWSKSLHTSFLHAKKCETSISVR